MNETMKNFGYPETLINEYNNWVLLLRPQQVTLGSLVLICKNEADEFHKISLEAFAELKRITEDIETRMKDYFSYNKINYLMLMMVDQDVHFHVFPRYAEERNFSHKLFNDTGWPGPPDLTQVNKTGETTNCELQQTLQQIFNRNNSDTSK